MEYLRVRVRCSPALLEHNSPILIYGEAAAGKTLASLSLAAWYARIRSTRVFLVTTEPQSTLPLASRLLPPDSLVYTVFSLEELADILLEVAEKTERRDAIVVDTLTAPYRVEAGTDAELSNRLLTFSAALLAKMAEAGAVVIAVSQVHADPEEGRVEPPGYRLIRGYFPLRVRLERSEAWRRVGFDEDGNVIFELILGDEGVAELLCTRRYSSS